MHRAPSASPLNRRRQCSPGLDLAITRPSNLLSSVPASSALAAQEAFSNPHADS